MSDPSPSKPAPANPARPSGLLPILPTAVLLAALIGGLAWLDSRQSARAAAAEARLETIEASLRLVRMEAGSAGKGVGALVEQIETWAPELAKASTPMPAVQDLEKRLEAVVDAVEPLGAAAFDPLVQKLESGTDPRQVEVRKWLLRAALRADPDRGTQLLCQVVRGNRVAATTRLRFVAADLLTETDKALAGEVLYQVLQVESHNGVSRQAPPELVAEYERHLGGGQAPDFFNFIPRYVGTGHAEVEATLLMLLGRSEHDRMTYQECVRQLGRMKSQEAVAPIKRLYEEIPKREFNPLFQNVCLQALADIQGGAACPWFQEQLRLTDVPLVAARLRELIKQLCGGGEPQPARNGAPR